MNEEILNTRGDQAFYMGAENAKIESAEKSAETGGHRNFYWDILCSKLSTGENGCGDEEDQNKTELFFADFSFFMHGSSATG
jgi:hypothetical protein